MLPVYTQLLNELVESRRVRRYLEIGSGYGFNFRHVKCDDKTSVDPYFDAHHKMDSDTFFAHHVGIFPPYDLIYIDGDSDPSQTQRDMYAALGMLTPGGIVVVRDVDETPERKTMWEKFRYMSQHRCYREPIEFGAAIIDTKYKKDETIHVAVEHSFFPVNYNFGHFFSDVLPNVHRFWQNHYLPELSDKVQFYCTTFHELLRPYSSLPVQRYCDRPPGCLTLNEAPREIRRGLDLLKQARDHVRDTFIDPSTYNRTTSQQVTILQRTTTRTLDQEDRLRYAIERRLKMPCQLIDPSTLSMGGQMYLAAATRVLIGVHGAGMTLCCFMKPGTVMLEITPPTYPTWWYKQFAEKFGIDYHSVEPTNADKMPNRPEVETIPIEVHMPTIFAIIEKELYPEKYPL